MDLAEQLLSPSKVLDLIRLRTVATTTTSKKKKIATTLSSTFLGGLNGKQVLEMFGRIDTDHEPCKSRTTFAHSCCRSIVHHLRTLSTCLQRDCFA